MERNSKKNFLGPQLSFNAAESYKLLRANIDFCVPDEGKCRIIGINSALRSEGKSTTSINLGYMLAETGKTVLLIEGDMRLPSICRGLGIPETQGLSNILAGQADYADCIKPSGLLINLHILGAGEIPPNPSELLGMNKLDILIDKLKSEYDFIIFDMPPVNEVSDSLVMSRIIDGMIMVVRKDYCFKEALSEAMKKVELSGVNVIGFVLNKKDDSGKKGKKYGGRYYKYG